jgi:hypothetical protein
VVGYHESEKRGHQWESVSRIPFGSDSSAEVTIFAQLRRKQSLTALITALVERSHQDVQLRDEVAGNLGVLLDAPAREEPDRVPAGGLDRSRRGTPPLLEFVRDPVNDNISGDYGAPPVRNLRTQISSAVINLPDSPKILRKYSQRRLNTRTPAPASPASLVFQSGRVRTLAVRLSINGERAHPTAALGVALALGPSP